MLRSLSSSSSFFQSILHLFNTFWFSMNVLDMCRLLSHTAMYVCVYACMYACMYAYLRLGRRRPYARPLLLLLLLLLPPLLPLLLQQPHEPLPIVPTEAARLKNILATHTHFAKPPKIRAPALPLPPNGEPRRHSPFGSEGGRSLLPSRVAAAEEEEEEEGRREAGLLPSPFPFFPPRPNERSFLSRAPLPPFSLYPSFFSFRSLRFLLRRQRRKREEKRPEGNGFVWEGECFQDVYVNVFKICLLKGFFERSLHCYVDMLESFWGYKLSETFYWSTFIAIPCDL